MRFTFSPPRFNVRCSDLGEFKVARAVAASAAVPIAFAAIVLENYDTCRVEEPAWLPRTRERAHTDPRLGELVSWRSSLTRLLCMTLFSLSRRQ
jgi:NTE family protein